MCRYPHVPNELLAEHGLLQASPQNPMYGNVAQFLLFNFLPHGVLLE
jgi:hypothetical protein